MEAPRDTSLKQQLLPTLTPSLVTSRRTFRDRITLSRRSKTSSLSVAKKVRFGQDSPVIKIDKKKFVADTDYPSDESSPASPILPTTGVSAVFCTSPVEEKPSPFASLGDFLAPPTADGMPYYPRLSVALRSDEHTFSTASRICLSESVMKIDPYGRSPQRFTGSIRVSQKFTASKSLRVELAVFDSIRPLFQNMLRVGEEHDDTSALTFGTPNLVEKCLDIEFFIDLPRRVWPSLGCTAGFKLELIVTSGKEEHECVQCPFSLVSIWKRIPIEDLEAERLQSIGASGSKRSSSTGWLGKGFGWRKMWLSSRKTL